MRHLHHVGTPLRSAARDLMLAGGIGVTATALALAATVLIAIVAPV